MESRVLRSILVVLVVLVAATGTVQAQSVVAVAANDYNPPDEHDNMVATLQNMGYITVDVTSTDEAAAAGACVLIVYAAGADVGDLQAWVDGGNGLIEIGDWNDYFPNQWQGRLPTPTTVHVTLNAPTHPIAQGLDPEWDGRGYFYYAWPDGALGNTTGALGETDIATVSAPGFETRNYGIAAYDPEPGGRAVYFGINVYGPEAGPNELRLFQNSLTWAGCAAAAPIPTVSGGGIAVMVLLLAGLAVAAILRFRLG